MRRKVKTSESFHLSGEVQKNKDKLALLQEGLGLFLLVVGMIWILTGLSGRESMAGLITAEITGLIFAGILFALRVKGKEDFLFLLAIPIITAAYCIFQQKSVLGSLALIYNTIGEKIAAKDLIIVLPLSTEAVSAMAAILPLSMIIAEAAYLTASKAKPLAIAILFANILALLYGAVDFSIGFAIMAMASLFITAQMLSGRFCLGQMKLHMLGYSMAIFTVLMLVINAANLLAVLNPAGFREEIEENLHSFRYENAEQPLPEGKFGRQKEAVGSDIMLKVKMEEAQPMYLRGYVGEVYSSDGWKRLDYKDVREARNIAYLLQENGFDGQTQLSEVAHLLGEDKEHPKTKVDIEVVGACREYFFVPYGIESDSELISKDDIGDTASKTKGFYGQDEYSYLYIGNLEGNAYEYGERLAGKTEDEAFKTYMKNEAEYRKFVYDHYMEVPEEEAELISDKIGVAHENLTTYEAKAIIRKLFEKNAAYTVAASEECRRPDFLKAFLNGASGNSVQYASAAVLMMRECGIPARYVEGFAVSPADYKYASGEVTAEVSSASARAWAEYYEDGVGWIPFDTVPMYKDMLPESKWQNFSEDSLRLIESAGNEIGSASSGRNEEGGSSNPPEEEENIDDSQEEEEYLEVSLMAAILLAVFFILVVIAIILSLRRMITLRKRKSLFLSKEVNAAITAMFAHSVRMMQAAGFEREKNIPLTYCGDLAKQWFGENIDFVEIAKLNEEALFSRHEFNEEHREKMKAFMERVKSQNKKKTGLAKRLKFKWINCLY